MSVLLLGRNRYTLFVAQKKNDYLDVTFNCYRAKLRRGQGRQGTKETTHRGACNANDTYICEQGRKDYQLLNIEKSSRFFFF